MKKNKLLYNPDNDWREPISDFIDNGTIKRIKKPKKVNWLFWLIVCSPLIIWVCVGLYLGEIRVEKTQSAVQPAEHTMIQINGKDAIMWENPDGTKSARVQYKNCYNVATIKGWVEYCDKEIVNVNWE